MKEICKYLTVCAVCSCLVKLACVFKGREKMPGEHACTTITETGTFTTEDKSECETEEGIDDKIEK